MQHIIVMVLWLIAACLMLSLVAAAFGLVYLIFWHIPAMRKMDRDFETKREELRKRMERL